VLLAGLGLGALVLLVAAFIAEQFPAAADRRQIVAEFRLLPAALSGLLGTPINIDRLGGFISWRVGNFMPVILGIWSVLALSGTLAGEARAGSLEVLAATPFSRRRIALEKVAAHLAGLAVAAALIGLAGWLGGLVFGRLEGDAIALGDSVAHFAGVALLGLVAGAVAFGLGPIVGRASAAGIGIAVLLAAFLVNAYASVIPAFEQVQGSSWFAWTANQRPIAGSWDALSLVPVVTLVVAFLALGVVAFERRDLGATVRLPSIVLPGRRLGLRGPASQALASRVPVALAWGVGIGVWAWLIALASRDFATRFGSDPAITRLIEQIFSGVPWRTPSGFLQLFFFSFAVMILGLAAAAMVSGVAAEERERRLELPLSTPVSRARWTVGNGVGVFGALAIVTLVIALFAAAGASAGGQDPLQPFIGAWVGGLYAAGLAGVGLAVVGLGAVDLGAPVTAALALGFLLWDVIGSALRLPPEILDLTLTRHLGRPMIGTYDWPGMLILAAMVVGGLLVAVWGMRRRDVSA
jgi:ABC-2 type transport system permease protein